MYSFRPRVAFCPFYHHQAAPTKPRCIFAKTQASRLCLGLVGLPDGNAEGGEEAGNHVQPVSDGEELGLGIEGQVGVGTLGVVVGRGHARAGGVEHAAAHDVGHARAGAEDGLRRHLD